jgi:hypothetical protein
MPPPPGNIPLPKPPAADLSVRERYVEHSGNPQCRSCHTALDPLGFAFETYDGIGGWQKMDGGKPVDATGTVTLGGTAKPFKNALELVRLLAASEEVSRCMTSQWARFGLGRPDEDDDRASLDEAYAAFARSGLDLRELLVAFVRSKTFLYRRPAAGEVL